MVLEANYALGPVSCALSSTYVTANKIHSSFIPVKIDYTDLHDILAFFIGDEKGERGRDDLGERIGRQGKEWAAEYWREVDMQGVSFKHTGIACAKLLVIRNKPTCCDSCWSTIGCSRERKRTQPLLTIRDSRKCLVVCHFSCFTLVQ